MRNPWTVRPVVRQIIHDLKTAPHNWHADWAPWHLTVSSRAGIKVYLPYLDATVETPLARIVLNTREWRLMRKAARPVILRDQNKAIREIQSALDGKARYQSGGKDLS